MTDLEQLWDYYNPAASEARFREVLEQTDGQAEVLTQIARAQGLQGHFEQARQTLELAQQRIQTARGQIRYLLELGRVLNSSGQPEASRPYFLQAWELAKTQAEDFLAVDAAHMLGIVEQGKALEWNLKALSLAQQSPDPKARAWQASLYNNIGWAFHDQGQFETALQHFQKAVSERERQGPAREILIAKWCVGRCLRSLGRTDEALALQRTLLAEYQQRGEHDGYVYEELGECLLSENPGEARKFFALAHEHLGQDSWLRKNEPERLERLHQPSKT